MSLKSLVELIITDPADRQSLMTVAEKYPDFTKKVEKSEQWDDWTNKYWDYDHEMTKEEWRLKQLNDQLQAQVAAAPSGEEMSPEQLQQFLDTELGKRGYVDKTTLDTALTTKLGESLTAKEKELMQYQAALMNGAMRANYYAVKYRDEYGELVDPNTLLEGVNKYNATAKESGKAPLGIDDYYKEFTAEKAAAKAAKDATDREAAIRADERRKAKEEIAMGDKGQMPVSMEGPQLGHFQERLMKSAAAPEPGKANLDGAELGKGLIARTRAREADMKELTGQVQ